MKRLVWLVSTMGLGACSTIFGIDDPIIVESDGGHDGAADGGRSRMEGGRDDGGKDAGDANLECKPRSRDCSGDAFRVCSPQGAWKNPVACTGGRTCSGGKCVCTQTICGSACVNTSHDGTNCGSCGHDCFGGTCLVGSCQPVVLAVGPDAGAEAGAMGLAVDTQNVYWTVLAPTGLVMQVALDGGATTTLASGQASPASVVVEPPDVYFGTVIGPVVRVPVGGGALTTLVMNYSPSINRLASNPTAVFWTSQSDGYIGYRPLPGSGTAWTSVIGGLTSPRGLAIDSASLYWLSEDSSWNVTSVPLGGGPTTHVASGAANTSGIAVDATTVYWTAMPVPGGGLVLSTPKGGGGLVSTIASAQDGPEGIAVDATHVYWVDNGAGTVIRAPILGGASAMTLATGQPGPVNVALDATSVYWTNNGSAAMAVMRLAK